MPPYHHPRLFTGNRTLDAVLTCWYGACNRSGPPRWEDLADLIWHPWCANLLMVESWSRMKPPTCAASGPLAAMLLGLPIGFRGVLPAGNPRREALTELTRLVSARRRLVFRTLAAQASSRTGVTANRPWIIGIPLAPAPSPTRSIGVERVLFAMVNGQNDGNSL